jgi:arylsulfatase A-like enzyme
VTTSEVGAGRWCRRIAAALGATAILGCAGERGVRDAGPSIVVYVIDTLRRDRLQPYGYPRPTSPRLAELARECTVYDRAHAAAPWTLPSVVTLLTSRDPLDHGVLTRGQRISDASRPLAERLQGAGWRTGCFVDNPFGGSASGLDRGCDHYERERGRRVDAERVGRWLDAGSGPTFLYLHAMEPHRPFQAPQRFLDAVGGVSIGERLKLERRLRIYRRLTTWSFQQAHREQAERDGRLRQRLHGALARSREILSRAYDAEVAWADENLGAVVDAIRARRRWDSTLLIVTSDHGEELLDHGDVLHGQSLYAELVRVPLIVCDPRRPGARRVATTVSLLDVMPTVLASAGLPADGTAGRDLATLGGGGAPLVTSVRVNRHLYSPQVNEARGDLNVAVDDGRWRGIWNVEADVLELYDTDADPDEQHDRAAAHPETAAALAAVARDWSLGRWPADLGQRTADLHGLAPTTMERLRTLGYLND